MARFFIVTCILCIITCALTFPIESQLPNDTPYLLKFPSDLSSSSNSQIERRFVPKPIASKYEDFANNALYYGFNTAKVGAAVGVFCLVLTVTERLARWVYRHVRGSIQYWNDEINDLRNGGVDSDQIALEKDEFVNDREGWASPVIEKRGRHVKWTMID